jgi:hypothetical protein
VYPPIGVVVAVATLKVEDPPAAITEGKKEAVAPEGRPLTVKFTVPLNPDCGPMETV